MGRTIAPSKPKTVPRPPKRCTFEEFLAYGEDTTLAEWEDGRIIEMTVSNRHQQLVLFVVAMINEHRIKTRDKGMVSAAPYAVRLRDLRRGREPDVLYVSEASLPRMHDAYLDGAPDLAVEIVSSESRNRDREVKFHEYAQAGVREYWIIDPDRRQAEFFELEEIGRFKPLSVDKLGRIHSVVLSGLWWQVDWYFINPLPMRPELEAWWAADDTQSA